MRIITNSMADIFDTVDFSYFNNMDIGIFVENKPTLEELNKFRYKIYYHTEPEEYFSNHSYIKENYKYFDYIFTWNNELLMLDKRFIFLPFGSTSWMAYPEMMPRAPNCKNHIVSFLRGRKHSNIEGHHLRWELWDRQNEINIHKNFIHGTEPWPIHKHKTEEHALSLNKRYELLKPSMYHICIENSKHPSYFTEKIMDCFLTCNIPIYFGCPNIGNFFDEDSIICFNSVDELISKINNFCIEEYYMDRFPIISKNYELAKKYYNPVENLKNKLKELF